MLSNRNPKSAIIPEKTKAEQIVGFTVRCHQEMLDWIDRRATQTRRSRSDVVSRLLEFARGVEDGAFEVKAKS